MEDHDRLERNSGRCGSSTTSCSNQCEPAEAIERYAGDATSSTTPRCGRQAGVRRLLRANGGKITASLASAQE
jgi:hypothetical protein